MTRTLASVLAALLLFTAVARAADSDQQAVLQEVGALLAWRLGPQAIEAWCRNADPEGAGIRKAALDSWQQRNAERIKSVDARVAEVVPMLKLPIPDGDPVQAVRIQVEMMFLESTFKDKSPEETRAICKAEADPAKPRWNNTGMPHIQQSLSALYDWQVAQGGK